MTKVRKSNIELLRVLSMFFIVFSHVTWEGHFIYPKENILHNTEVQFPWLFGQIGVITFTLISSYFLSKKKKINKKSIINLAKVTWFWSILILGITVLLKDNDLLGLKVFINSLFPILRGTYWYVTAYIAMYLIMPYLNIVIDKLTKKEYITFLMILIVVFSIIPTFAGTTSLNSTNSSSSVYSLIIIYFLGGFIRKFESEFVYPVKKLTCLFVVSVLISCGVLLLLNIANMHNIIDITGTNRLYGRFMRTNSIFQIISGTLLFLIFKNLEIRHNKYINGVAKNVFGIYIIHTNPIVMEVLWNRIIRINRYENSPYIILIEIIVAIVIFIICLLLEMIRGKFWMLCTKVVKKSN